MAISTTILDGLPARFLVSCKRGAPLVIEFVVAGVPSLVTDSWIAVVRGRGGSFVSYMTILTSLATVYTSNDSARINASVSSAVTANLKPGNYIFDIQDTTTDQVWADGKIKILRNTVIA
jgi:hypothetical protein